MKRKEFKTIYDYIKENNIGKNITIALYDYTCNDGITKYSFDDTAIVGREELTDGKTITFFKNVKWFYDKVNRKKIDLLCVAKKYKKELEYYENIITKEYGN